MSYNAYDTAMPGDLSDNDEGEGVEHDRLAQGEEEERPLLRSVLHETLEELEEASAAVASGPRFGDRLREYAAGFRPQGWDVTRALVTTLNEISTAIDADADLQERVDLRNQRVNFEDEKRHLRRRIEEMIEGLEEPRVGIHALAEDEPVEMVLPVDAFKKALAQIFDTTRQEAEPTAWDHVAAFFDGAALLRREDYMKIMLPLYHNDLHYLQNTWSQFNSSPFAFCRYRSDEAKGRALFDACLKLGLGHAAARREEGS